MTVTGSWVGTAKSGVDTVLEERRRDKVLPVRDNSDEGVTEELFSLKKTP